MQVAFYLQRAFFPIKVKLESSSRYNDQRLDVLVREMLSFDACAAISMMCDHLAVRGESCGVSHLLGHRAPPISACRC